MRDETISGLIYFNCTVRSSIVSLLKYFLKNIGIKVLNDFKLKINLQYSTNKC